MENTRFVFQKAGLPYIILYVLAVAGVFTFGRLCINVNDFDCNIAWMLLGFPWIFLSNIHPMFLYLSLIANALVFYKIGTYIETRWQGKIRSVISISFFVSFIVLTAALYGLTFIAAVFATVL